MTGEKNLEVLLSSMRPHLQEGVFVFCTLPSNQKIPADLELVGMFREKEGATLFLLKDEAEKAGLTYAFESRLITLNVHSSLNAVGFLAAVSSRLAVAGISVNAISAFYHDHLFIPQDRAEEALKILESLT